MKSGVKVIKRGTEEGLRGLPPVREEKTDREREREIAGTVKEWVAEWESAKSARRTEFLRLF